MHSATFCACSIRNLLPPYAKREDEANNENSEVNPSFSQLLRALTCKDKIPPVLRCVELNPAHALISGPATEHQLETPPAETILVLTIEAGCATLNTGYLHSATFAFTVDSARTLPRRKIERYDQKNSVNRTRTCT